MRDISCSWIRKLNIVRVSILLKLIHKFNAIPIKSQQALLCRNWQADTKIYMKKYMVPRIVKSILEKKKGGGLTVFDFMIYIKAIKTKQYWTKDRQTNRTD